jgi:hypothetical protein
MRKIYFLFFLALTTSAYAQSTSTFNDVHRKLEMKNNTIRFSYVYLNKTPYGKNATVVYDNFYKTYQVTFTKQNGMKTGCTIQESNFISTWSFKYNGKVYELTNYSTY